MVRFGVIQSRGRFTYDERADDAKLSFPRNGDAEIWSQITGAPSGS